MPYSKLSPHHFIFFLCFSAALLISGCTKEAGPLHQIEADGRFSAPLPKTLSAEKISDNNLIVEIIVDQGKEPEDRRRLIDLTVDLDRKTFSGKIPGVLSAGAHRFRLVFILIDPRYGETPIATTDDVNATIIADQASDIDFSAAVLILTDSDGDRRSNMEELARGWNPNQKAPEPPGDFSAIPGDQEVSLSWEAVEGAISYTLYWKTGNGVTENDSTITELSETQFTHTGLENKRGYYYVVIAVGLEGDSFFSIEKEAIPQNSPPEVRVFFPTQVSLTSAKVLTITGQAKDRDGVAAVRVNGIFAQTEDGFAHWKVQNFLNPGQNILSVETEDKLGNINPNAMTLTVEQTVALLSPSGFALDVPGSKQAFVTDTTLRALVAVDLETGYSSIVSDATTGTGPLLLNPDEMVLDPVARRALVVDSELFSIDLDSGNRTLILSPVLTSNIVLWGTTGIGLDRIGNRVILSNYTAKGLLAIDLITGTRNIISDASTGTGPPLKSPSDLALDILNNRAFVIDTDLKALVQVDLGTGDRTVISDDVNGTGPPLTMPRSLVLDLGNNRALVTNRQPNALFEVNLTSGNRKVLSGPSRGLGLSFSFSSLLALALDETQERVFGSDWLLDGIFMIELSTGNRSISAQTMVGTGPRMYPRGLTLGDFAERGFVFDGFSANALLEIDFSTGNRRFISDKTTSTGPRFSDPRRIAIDSEQNKAFVIDNNVRALISIDLVSGDRTLVSGDNRGAGPAFVRPSDLSLDIPSNRAFVLDEGLDAIVSIDLFSGQRTLFSSGADFSESPFSGSGDMILDLPRNRAFLQDYVLDALLEVDFISSRSRIISADNVGTGEAFGILWGFALDLAKNQAIVINSDSRTLISVNLSTGDRSIISGASRGLGPPLSGGRYVVLDLEGGRAFVTGLSGGPIMTVDLESGDRVISSKMKY